ncbi:hypothetical protein FSARC_11184 [Fusarium sarcochroum]|uniref:Xylanolytic transcriptional activator regulatory domain-containing protein n=1 Tax=Fusarium sarcochroum TaxID=1208366 RepID=A0A8H4TGY5_9HYPO|nr:hypothetical protein FSARC_11184 [Fusarium sarcochroum]
MVTSLIDTYHDSDRPRFPHDGSTIGDSPASHPRVPTEPGDIFISSTSPIYVGGGHWKAILGEISELREDLAQWDPNTNINDYAGSPMSGSSVLPRQGPLLLSYGNYDNFSFTRETILAALPDRRVVDRLVFSYFNELMPPFAIVHPPSFLQQVSRHHTAHAQSRLVEWVRCPWVSADELFAQYQNFWNSPDDVPIFWIGLLFSIICLSTQRQQNLASSSDSGNTDQESDPEAKSRPALLDQVTQCLLLGRYHNGGAYLIETLLHYMVIEHSSCLDSQTGNWLLFGIILRLALRMGYHRDPSLFPAIGVFHCEMRRRIWLVLYSMDTILSLQMGMPRMVKDGQWDTKPPRHLVDADLSEAMAELPPSRPVAEVTMTLFLLSRHEMTLIMGRIADWALATEETGSPELDSRILERRLRDAYASIDSGLKFTALSDCLSEPAPRVMWRLGTTVMYLQGLVYLTWRHLLPKSTSSASTQAIENNVAQNSGAAASRQTCIDSALKLLEYHDLVDAEGQPGGILYAARYVITSTLAHPFLMATTILTAHLSQTRTKLSPTLDNQHTARTAEIERILRQSHQVWIRQSARGSADARRASDMLGQLFQESQEPQTNRFFDWQDLVHLPQDHQMPVSWDTFPIFGSSNLDEG